MIIFSWSKFTLKINLKIVANKLVVFRVLKFWGRLKTNLKGDLTLDHDGSGYFIISGGVNATTQIGFYPNFVDGAYIKVIGKNYGGTQLSDNSDVLGTVIFDYRNNPADHTNIGKRPYDTSRTILKDGFTYTSRKEY